MKDYNNKNNNSSKQHLRSNILWQLLVIKMLLVITTEVATVASVLVQNSENAATADVQNSNNNNSSSTTTTNNNNKNNHNNALNLLTKFKRSPAVPIKNDVNKKSSLEIVPAFNAQPLQHQQQQEQKPMQLFAGSGTAVAPSRPTFNPTYHLEYDQQPKEQLWYGGETPTPVHKRGINPQQQKHFYGTNNNLYNHNQYWDIEPAAGAFGAPDNGIWSNDLDPSVMYTDLQDDYVVVPPRVPMRNKAYDNLQNLLNSETYLQQPVVLPIQYPSQDIYPNYYTEVDRNKRTKLNRFNRITELRLKRDTKLTPADMLALVALVEAGERARTDDDKSNYLYPAEFEASPYKLKNFYPNGYDYSAPLADEVDYSSGVGTWSEPNVIDYYGLPMNVPRYEVSNEQKFNGGGPLNNLPPKRYMIASQKKKRSVGKFIDESLTKPIITKNGEKNF